LILVITPWLEVSAAIDRLLDQTFAMSFGESVKHFCHMRLRAPERQKLS
jgi:hypothetical protein